MQKNTKNAVQDLWIKGVTGECGGDQLCIRFDSRLIALPNQIIRFHFLIFLTVIGMNYVHAKPMN